MPSKPTYRGLTLRKLADRSKGERISGLLVPMSAMRFDEATGTAFVDPAKAEKILFNPATPALEHEPWPYAGMAVEGEPVKHARIPTSTVSRGRQEGWISVVGETVVHRSGGPPEEPWRVTHTFPQLEYVILHTVDGDLRYRVVENPDKWPDEKRADEQGEPGFGGEVRWYYDCELEADG